MGQWNCHFYRCQVQPDCTNGDGVADAAEPNVISGNLNDGIYLCDHGTEKNVVAGNFIGTDVTGTLALGNAGHGVGITYEQSAT